MGKNLINPYLQVPTVEHTYSLRQGRNSRPDYTNRYGFQAKIIYFSLTQLPMKRRLRKFKQIGEKDVTAELEQLHRRDAFRPVITENLSEKHKHEFLVLVMFFKKKETVQ